MEEHELSLYSDEAEYGDRPKQIKGKNIEQSNVI